MAGPSIGKLEEKIVLDALRNGWYGKNAYYYVEKLENDFAKFHNRKFALMTPNCTTALHLLLATLGIKEGDEVIVPDCTWIGSSACVKYQKAETIFADIDPLNWCLTAESIQKVITKKTKAVIVVDLYGNMPNWKEILQLCKDKKIYAIEDSAESLGSVQKGVRAGKFGIGSVFSFHRTKTMTTGEGGMLLLDDNKLYNRAKFLRDHGRQPGSYYLTEVAYKYMPSNLQASLGYAQFLRLDDLVKKKRSIWKNYCKKLSDIPDIQLNIEPNGDYNSVWNTALIFGKSHKMNRNKALKELAKLNLPARPFFYPLSSLPAYPGKYKIYKNKNKNAYDISSRGINLPSALNLTKNDIDIVAKGIRKMLEF